MWGNGGDSGSSGRGDRKFERKWRVYEPITAGWELFRSVMDDVPYLRVSHSFTLDYIISISIICQVVIVVRHCRPARSVERRWQTGEVDNDGAKLQDPERGICVQLVREHCRRGQLCDSYSSSEY